MFRRSINKGTIIKQRICVKNKKKSKRGRTWKQNEKYGA